MEKLEAQLINENIEYFNKNLDEIEKKYGENQYLVIKDKKIVDNGEKLFELASKYSKEIVLITNVRNYKETKEVPSPEIAR